jgi:hypothetical protein
MDTRRRIGIAAAAVALLLPIAANGATPAQMNSICRSDFAAATKWSRSVPPIESDAQMAAWEYGVASHFGRTAKHLRAVAARPLATQFDRVAAGHRTAAVAYLSGRLSRVKAANAQLRTASTQAMSVAKAARAPACAAYVKNYRP